MWNPGFDDAFDEITRFAVLLYVVLFLISFAIGWFVRGWVG